MSEIINKRTQRFIQVFEKIIEKEENLKEWNRDRTV